MYIVCVCVCVCVCILAAMYFMHSIIQLCLSYYFIVFHCAGGGNGKEEGRERVLITK